MVTQRPGGAATLAASYLSAQAVATVAWWLGLVANDGFRGWFELEPARQWSAWVMAVLGKGTPVPFDAARELVVAGPYRIVRNPMAVSAINQTIGVAVLLGSFGVLGLAAGGAVVWHTVIRPPEERFLVRTFGAPYERYRRAVRCWVPRWPPYAPGP